MIIDNLANHRPDNFWKSKCLMAQLKTTAWQYLRYPVAFLRRIGRNSFFLFIFNIQKEIVKSVASSRNLSTAWYMTSLRQAVGNDMKKIFITFDFHILH